MLDVRYSTKFKKDFKSCVKRGYKMSLLQQVIDTLRIPENFFYIAPEHIPIYSIPNSF